MVVPVRDGGESLERCLEALARSATPPLEILVVDDGSRDGSPARAAAAGARVLTAGGRGPAAARNVGARAACGEWILFLDADCVVHPATLGRLLAAIAGAPGAAAVFGAYDDRPPAPGLVSQYRNLLHAFTHRTGRKEASTFWSGCGAVRRDAFESVGGFDAARFPGLGMEDIDLGYRLRAAGHRIRLAPEVQVTHLKRWTVGEMLRVDLHERALPWTQLWLERGRVPADLAIGWRARVAVATVASLVATPVLAPFAPRTAAATAVAALAIFLAAQAPFLADLRRRRGLGFALSAIPLHLLHTATAALGFALGVLRHLARGARRATVVSRRPRSTT